MTEHYAKQGTYENVPAVYLKHGRYSAIMLPTIGGNLISFRDDESGYRFIREPEGADWEAFMKKPMLHGIPVLFPPNRYDGGAFEFAGRSYRLPINEPQTGNHIHGFVYQSEWEVAEIASTETESRVMVKLVFDESHPGFAFFPHRVVFHHTFAVSADGLRQTFEAVNESEETIPFMLGFHTTLNAPFAPGSELADIQVGLAIGERWDLNARQLTTGQKFSLNEGESLLRQGTGNPYFEALDNHYTSSPVNGKNAVSIYDDKAGTRFVYDAGDAYKHWMVYNAVANGKFFCPEPQTGMVNAPNIDLPAEQTGLIGLKPGERWTGVSRMYAE
ncbi:aldose 1-epimerase [Cohnella endophytica]|uniref:Aldose 1-epimerase n=1 Tax=Cohnella endophytica TaxID=2419778 RepID=A0A494Y474_9BACL|nr:aldose 1-epimerase [Cohnella endophytica]RKP55076.1 aldose 1-epimerase [Cohnella endophytica]